MKLTYEEIRELESDIDYDDPDYDSDVGTEFADMMRNFLTDLVKDALVSERFVSSRCFLDHFNNHCIGHRRNFVSTEHNIKYDFTDPSQYSAYESTISREVANVRYIIDSLFDYETINKYMLILFDGNQVVQFSNSCGIRNSTDIVNISFISFASDVTTNYRSGNTISICIKSARGRTISLYPIDAHYFQTKLNNMLDTYYQDNSLNYYSFNND